jgi:hypothetical protein
VLRCIFGAKQENEIWRKIYNYELYEIFNDSNIANYIKVKRLAWAGHLMCMNDKRTLEKKISTKLDSVRRVGRPKMRWQEGVEQGTRMLDVTSLEEGRPQQRRMGKAS